MTFTKEQMEILSTFEKHFTTAVKSQWARHPGQAGLQVIFTIFKEATGDRRNLNGSCQSCILHLLQDCGRIYFADKEEMEKEAQVQAEPVVAEPKPKRTRKPKTK